MICRTLTLLFFVFLNGAILNSQNISGVINIYTPVTAINNTSCMPTITVASSTGFSVGDTALIIQMKGALIDTTNTASFGSISGYGNCGNYEFCVIAGIAGNVITLQYSLLRTYTVSQYVQLVGVPVYNNANISATLSAQSWNLAAGTGGVLTFIDKGTTTLNANIDVNDKGFQGTPTLLDSGYVSCSIKYKEPASGKEALKGESIAILAVTDFKGTASPANGGGGGITDNGGGGAANFGAGGPGGKDGWVPVTCGLGAQGGKALTYSNALNKIYLGGAGGDAQHAETFHAGKNLGMSGGGIVILRTTAITGNNFSILAKGKDAPVAVQDGGGGGGAGGTVLLECPVYTTNLNVNTSGGKGGDAIYNPVKCSGGGGGGGGALWVSTAAVSGSISYTSAGGVGGTSMTPAVNGVVGNAGGTLVNLLIPQSNLGGSMVVNAASVNILCNGQNNGSATASTSGGASPFTYLWSNGQTTSAVTGLAAGNYTITVSDFGGCTNTMTVQVTEPPALIHSVSATIATCSQLNGSASSNVSGGTPGYTYSWSNSGTSASITGLSGGNFTVTVTDANGCSDTQTVMVASSNNLNSTLTQTNIQCNGGSATATVTPAGGTPVFTYAWSNGQTTSAATGLAPGSYSVLITDAGGCTSTNTVTFTMPAAITSSVSVTNTTCGNSTGSASVTAGGGTGSLTYSWSPGGQTTASITGLAGGTYTCLITDASGCTKPIAATVVNLNGPAATASVTAQVSCNGGSNGSAIASATGGSAPYTFLWSNGQTTSAATSMVAGTYSVNIADASGCTLVQVVTVTQPSALVVTVLPIPDTCAQNVGSAGAIASNGTGPYSYLWSNGQTAQTATGLGAGTYSVTITDANGCTLKSVAAVGNMNTGTASAGTNVTIQFGSSTNLNASGGVLYSWTPTTGLSNTSVANPTATPSVTTEYCVYVTDSYGCTDSACVTVYVDIPCGEFYLPNAFSPNSDSENDGFKAYILPACVKEFKLIIYNRWGQVIFETEDVTKSWDGYFQDKLSNAAVYAFFCKAKFTNGKEIVKKGNVSLVR